MLVQMWENSPSLTDESFLEFMQEMYPDLIIPVTEVVSELACEYYDSLGDSAFAQPIPAPPVEMLRVSVRWAITTGDKVTGLKLLQGSTDKRIYNAARETILHNTNLEPGTKWARRPNSADACDWCHMLATRGAAYLSESTAGRNTHFHDNCHCLAVPVRPGRTYTVPDFVKPWN